MFCTTEFASRTVRLAAGDTLLLYTDGVIEARDAAGADYGIDRLAQLAASADRRPHALLRACLADLTAFRQAAGADDDVTVVAIRRA
jgi:serine phosphatase RsbU (regulator of sigma subunit)